MNHSKIDQALAKQGLDGFLLSSPENISYLVGFPSRDSYLVFSPDSRIYITDSRYFEEAKSKLRDCSVARIEQSAPAAILKACQRLRLKRIGFEAQHFTYSSYQKIREALGSGMSLIPVSGMVEDLRQIKTSRELEKISKAVAIAIEAFRFIKDFITAGKKEIEIAAELERFIRYNGAQASSFDIIVASGPNSSLPHHMTSERKLKNNEPVLVDMGVDYAGYKSDLTRVFFLGKINILVKRIYNIVLEAQQKAIRKIAVNAPISQVDTTAREHISRKGYGRFFGHALGHGVGLQVHEAPRISANTEAKFRPGMVFTVEPAIYLPGRFGVRIEDMCLVTQKGVDVLSGSLNK